MSHVVLIGASLMVWIALGWLLSTFVLKRPASSFDIEASLIYLLLGIAVVYAVYLQFFAGH
ncbi:hypothetical protein [Hydrogenophaga sp.]|uniref:hypothetical protein n=1 Tax=Hydrogenophaga sp. TaxID=1904254 RepID=UPI00286EA62B|nr:hypothetical protein [Hydrogenophaga sp.]